MAPSPGLPQVAGIDDPRGNAPQRRFFDKAAKREGLALQRSAHIGALTETSYVQLVGEGVAAIDLGFPVRYTHSSLEVFDLADLVGLTRLLVAGLARIDRTFSLDRDDFVQ